MLISEEDIKTKKLLVVLFFISFLSISLNFFLKKYIQPVAIVVPHHNIVQEKRLEFFKTVAKKRVKTNSIIILTPDHFSPNQFKISYSDRNWELSNGRLEFDNSLSSKIVDGLAKENGLVANDHGIYNLLPDIKKVWPEAKIIPLLVGQKLSFGRLSDLIPKIKDNCGYDCLLIASVDFSHYLPRALANIHDLESLEVLNRLEIGSEKEIEVDSPQSIYILIKYALSKKAKYFHFYSYSNSGIIEGTRDAETTSHFLGWYQKDFINRQTKNIYTFLVGRNLNDQKDKNTLGERFFYGVDYLNGQLEKDFKPSSRVIIKPGKDNNLLIKLENGVLQIFINDELAVAGCSISDKTMLVFLPVKKENSKNYLMRQEEKSNFFKKIFQNIDPNSLFGLDKNEGIIII